MTVKWPSSYQLYLALVVICGIGLISWSLLDLYQPEQPLVLGLLIMLAILSQYLTSSAVYNADGEQITYEVGTAIGVAAVPALGVSGAILVVLAANLSIWIIKPQHGTSWRKISTQLLFNTGMHTISIALAGSALIWVSDQLPPNLFLINTVPWLIAAVTYSLVNTWLLIFIIRLKNGSKVKMFQIFWDDLWASSIDIVIMAVGGSLLAYSSINYDLMGILIFFLPIGLSALAFSLYVRQMQTHLNNLESIVAERTASMQQLITEKDQFLAVLTHDMKSPLTSINLYAQILDKNPSILETKPQIAKSILESHQTLREIVDNILDLKKMEAEGEMQLTTSLLPLEPELNNLLESMSILATRKDIHLEKDFSFTTGIISGDRSKIKRVFQNIISNGIKYTPEGGAVTVRARESDLSITVEVEDSGYGIPNEDLPYIFDRFKRVESHKRFAPGTGLGLAITKALVEAHHGTIVVITEEGTGTSFTVTLPKPAYSEEIELMALDINFDNDLSPHEMHSHLKNPTETI